MAARRDYKHAGQPADKRGKGSGKGGGLFFGLLFGLAAGLAVAGGLIWYFHTQPAGFKTQTAAPPPAPGKNAKAEVKPAPTLESAGERPSAPAAANGAPDSGQYSFYDILAGDKTPKPLDPPKAAEAWWLQVAALKQAEAADALKARLTLLNLNAVVQSVESANGGLHRVRVGPFKNEEAAVSARETLIANNFEPRLLKEAVSR